MSFLDKHFTNLSKLARGTKCLLYECTGRRLLEACTRFPSDFVHVTFLCWFCFVAYHYKVTSDSHYHLSHFTFTWWPCLLFHWENKNVQKSTSSLCGWTTLTPFCQFLLSPTVPSPSPQCDWALASSKGICPSQICSLSTFILALIWYENWKNAFTDSDC